MANDKPVPQENSVPVSGEAPLPQKPAGKAPIKTGTKAGKSKPVSKPQQDMSTSANGADVKKAAVKKTAVKKVAAVEPKPAVKKVAAKKAAAKSTAAPVPKKAAAAKAPAPKKASPKETASVKAAPKRVVVIPPAAETKKTVPVADAVQRETARPGSKNNGTNTLRRIAFQVRFHTTPGQSIFVTGNHSLLGNNNYDTAFPLSYLNDEYWFGTLELAEGEVLAEDITYNYLLVNADGTTALDWGNDKVISPASYNTEEVLFVDTWNPSGLIENTFYSEPFQEVLLRENFTPLEPAPQPTKTTHIFRVKAPLLTKGQVICLGGSIDELGGWQTDSTVRLSRKEGEPWWTIALDLSGATFPFSYKYGVYDTTTSSFIQFESGNNRVLYDGGAQEKLSVISDSFAAIPYKAFKGAGIAIPVFSLRSANSFGVGEFADLKLLVDWAKQTGLKLIQLLPVNDTTATHTYTDSYPYAAISAFALHPLYLHLPAIVNKQNHHLLEVLADKQEELNARAEVDYVAVMAAKWQLIKKLFPSQKEATFKSSDFHSFFLENSHWLIPYAAFSYFREKYKTSDFNTWETNRSYNAEEISALASSPLKADEEVSIYYYVQYHLHLQLRDAARYAHANGIIVKGDIPIGIYRNSCDAWQQPELYNMDMQAGAPPDDFAIKGQNWGFPTYNWQRMREDGFSWWKRRFRQMSYYFDAFRIDHILGFFRIWSIPMDAVEGIMGHFVPAAPVHINEFVGRGIHFNHARFCNPYISDAVLHEIFGEEGELVKSEFLDDTGYGNYSLKEEYNTQRKVEAYFASLGENEHSDRLKQGLYDLISNIILFEVEGSEGQQFHFRISMEATASFRHLDGHTQAVLRDLYVSYFFRRQDDHWAKEAMLKLPELKRSTNMLVCGEDLGMVPDCVPGVMKDLAILSLEIQRMPKDPKRVFFHPNDAPYLSVVTPSTHDMSTIRGWWEEDRAATQQFFNTELGQWGTAPYFCEPWICRIILVQHFYSPAMWSIFQLQDLLSINGNIRRENPNEERINIPADPKHYWRYRMHISLEELLDAADFNMEVRGLVQQSGR